MGEVDGDNDDAMKVSEGFTRPGRLMPPTISICSSGRACRLTG